MKTRVMCWLVGLFLFLALGSNEFCLAGDAADVIQAGSTWRDNAGHTLIILERKGGTYRGRFTRNDQFIRDVTGSIAGDKISWLAKDVNPIKGGPGGDNFGTIRGDKIDFKYTGFDGKIARAGYTLTRVSGGNGGDPAGATGAAGDLVKSNRSNLVFITTPDGSGSGFIAHYGTGTFLITNAHVAAMGKGAMFRTLEGTQVQVGAPAVAVGHDIFIMALKPGTAPPLEVMSGVEKEVAIGDAVVVLGNAGGAGVVTAIEGKIVGLGPDLVEVDAPFQPGNSGSPIIHLKTGKVVGVATYLTIRKYDSVTHRPIKEPIIRRFGYRLDSIKSWQAVNWPSFYAQAAQMEAVEKFTRDLEWFMGIIGQKKWVQRSADANPIIWNRIAQWLAVKKKRLSPQDAVEADQNFLASLRTLCEADIISARQQLTYDYFQRELAEQERNRKEMAEAFERAIESTRK